MCIKEEKARKGSEKRTKGSMKMKNEGSRKAKNLNIILLIVNCIYYIYDCCNHSTVVFCLSYFKPFSPAVVKI